MIKFHPSQQMLKNFSAGELPLSLSIAVSAHIELCHDCAIQTAQIEASLSEEAWKDSDVENTDFGDMLQAIMTEPFEAKSKAKIQSKTTTHIVGSDYLLPTAFRQFKDLKWSGFGVISRARVINDEQNVRASLLHIGKNGRIPDHYHKGYELTLLLSGCFSDEAGTYNKGDFIWIEGDKPHRPYTDEGCLCYAVQDAPLHFVDGISKVLNPLGNLIY